jgi:two-component system response regulator RegX3
MHEKILIIEDNKELAESYLLSLEREGFDCTISPSAEEGLLHGSEKEAAFNLIILDEHSSRPAGVSDAHLMILTARKAEEIESLGVDAETEEYIRKPCPPRVLAARVQAYFKKGLSPSNGKTGSLWKFGGFEFDTEALYLTKEGRPVNLSPRESAILRILVEGRGKPFSPEEIYNKIWGQGFRDVSAVGVYIQRLRRKLDEDPSSPRHIQTQYGLGYRFNPETFLS